MTSNLLPGPAGDSEPSGPAQESPRQDQARQHHEQPRARSRAPRILSEEECLAALGQIPAALLCGVLTVAKANSMRAVYTSLLQHHQQRRRSGEERGGVADDGLVEMLSRHPEYANLLEPFLSDEQIAALMAQTANEEGANGSA